MILETLANAKLALGVMDADHDAEVQLYLEHASALIYQYMGAQAVDTWDETTAPDVVQAATLKMLCNLYEHRGDDVAPDDHDLKIWEGISLLLMRARDPALA
jgi:Phage gp6-like head-tail connector protein